MPQGLLKKEKKNTENIGQKVSSIITNETGRNSGQSYKQTSRMPQLRNFTTFPTSRIATSSTTPATEPGTETHRFGAGSPKTQPGPAWCL